MISQGEIGGDTKASAHSRSSLMSRFSPPMVLLCKLCRMYNQSTWQLPPPGVRVSTLHRQQPRWKYYPNSESYKNQSSKVTGNPIFKETSIRCGVEATGDGQDTG